MFLIKFATLLAFAIGCYGLPQYSEEAIEAFLQRSANEYVPEVRADDEDAHLTVDQLITKYGYPVEVSEVQTEDGYLLTVHRIPHGKNNAEIQNRPVVFLQHGLMASSADWVVMGPGKGLAYILADEGYDVFMGNVRGNRYSRKHIRWDPDYDEEQFWEYSWNEIGIYDLSAMIDFAIMKSGQEKIYYVGHSQGTTSFFVLMSERPQYNNKIKLMSALSPIVFMGNVPNIFLKFIAYFTGPVSALSEIIGYHEFNPSPELMKILGQAFCADHAVFQEVCANVWFLMVGYNSAQLNRTALPVILAHTPAGSATKQFYHYAQEMVSYKFRKYDFGLLGNYAKYGTLYPPNYNINNITTKVALYYGDNDSLADVDDVRKFKGMLKNNVHFELIPSFNHLDFLYAIDVPTLLYRSVINVMKNNP